MSAKIAAHPEVLMRDLRSGGAQQAGADLRQLILMGMLLTVQACSRPEQVWRYVDDLVFSSVGSTVFFKPEQVTMKKIHLDKGALVGQNVMVEGHVIRTGRYDTYMVMSDDTARMLVVLTDVDNKMSVLTRDIKSGRFPVRVIGTVEYGKKGLPFIQARNLRLGQVERSAQSPLKEGVSG